MHELDPLSDSKLEELLGESLLTVEERVDRWIRESWKEIHRVAARLCHARPADPSSGALVGHCHDRNRSFDLSPSLAALVRT